MTMSTQKAMTSLQWQLARDSAVQYQQVLVPTYFGPAAQALVRRAELALGESVLDVGCGTGAVARGARDLVGPGSTVLGVDVNRYMLDVARSLTDDVEFRDGDARQLPIRDQAFDVVLCGHTLPFIVDRARACTQLARVTKPGGRVLVSAWEALDRNPYYAALADALLAVMGPEVAFAVTSACTLSSQSSLQGLLDGAGLREVTVDGDQFEVDLGDLGAFLPRHIRATPMAVAFRAAGDEAVAQVVDLVRDRLDPARTGRVVVPFRQWVATGRT